MKRIGLAISISMLGAACSVDYGLSGGSRNSGAHGPAIRVMPQVLDFGTVTQEDGLVVRSFEVSSTGDTELTVAAIEIVDAAGSFTLIDLFPELVLPPGGSHTVDVAFDPQMDFEQTAQAWVYSDDPDDPRVPVEMFGAALVPELAWDPDPLSFGTGYVGCTKTQTLELVNVGAKVAEVYSIEGSDTTFELYDVPDLPFSLAPGESVAMLVDFTPGTDAAFNGKAIVTSSESVGTRTDLYSGDGQYAGAYEDVWDLPVDPPSDIIFYVDQSRSMEDDQERLAAAFSTFIDELDDYSSDWHIMVVNDDDGCNNSGILTPLTSDYESAFESAVVLGGGEDTEAGLTVTWHAVRETGADECNAGFLRDDAMLHIIMVSDEPEQSDQDWSNYVAAVQAIKGDDSKVKFSAISGPVPDGCYTAEAGIGYYESVVATDGIFLDICSDWSSSENFGLLAEASSSPQDTFELSTTPAPMTIEVSIDGIAADDSTWEFDVDTNSVHFLDSSTAPQAGATVVIDYSAQGICD